MGCGMVRRNEAWEEEMRTVRTERTPQDSHFASSRALKISTGEALTPWGKLDENGEDWEGTSGTRDCRFASGRALHISISKLRGYHICFVYQWRIIIGYFNLNFSGDSPWLCLTAIGDDFAHHRPVDHVLVGQKNFTSRPKTWLQSSEFRACTCYLDSDSLSAWAVVNKNWAERFKFVKLSKY